MKLSTVKTIVIPEGNVVKITQGETVLWKKTSEETIVNLVDTAGYTDAVRLSTSEGTFRDNTGTFATGLIQIKSEGDVIRTSGVNFNADDDNNCGIWIYQSDQTYWTYLNTNYSKTPVTFSTYISIDIDVEGNLVITPKEDWDGRWFRLCGIGLGANLIVTKN